LTPSKPPRHLGGAGGPAAIRFAAFTTRKVCDEAARCYGRSNDGRLAIADLNAVSPWDLAVTVWNDIEDGDRYLAVYSPAGVACRGIAQHFHYDAETLRQAAAPTEVTRVCAEQARYYAKAMQALGLQNTNPHQRLTCEFFVQEGQHRCVASSYRYGLSGACPTQAHRGR
jgi:hypothetical protein